MRARPLPPVRLWLFFLALAAALAAMPAARAADAANWWVYVANDNADEVRALLAQGADPNVRYRNGQPALMRAVVDDAWRVFDVIAADPRTDLNAENPAHETALMYLALAGQTERAATLIARGANVNRLGWTPLHYAASKGQLGAARLLLQHKAIVNAPSPRGVTPLMMAAFAGSREMINLLLRAGADSTTRDLDGKNAADWAEQGQSGQLAADLRGVIERAQAARQARRQAPAGTVPQERAPAPAPAPAAQAPAPAAAGATQEKAGDQPENSSASGVSGVSGVSGLGLRDYSKDDEP